MGLNVVVLMGRMVADPELKRTQSGVSVSSFRVAVDRSFSKEERKADFIDVVSWKGTAEFVCKYFHKGSMIALAGSLQTRNYEDKNGNKRTAYEVVANEVHFAESKERSTDNSSTLQHEATQHNTPVKPINYSVGSADDFNVIDDTEDMPF